MGGTIQEQCKQLVSRFQEVAKVIFRVDKMVVIHTWDENLKANTIKGKGKLPMNQDAINQYADCIFIKQGSYTYIRLLVGHTQAKSKFVGTQVEAFLVAQDMKLSIKPVQAKVTAMAGWFLGLDTSM